jgi:hypothetical protein
MKQKSLAAPAALAAPHGDRPDEDRPHAAKDHRPHAQKKRAPRPAPRKLPPKPRRHHR